MSPGGFGYLIHVIMVSVMILDVAATGDFGLVWLRFQIVHARDAEAGCAQLTCLGQYRGQLESFHIKSQVGNCCLLDYALFSSSVRISQWLMERWFSLLISEYFLGCWLVSVDQLIPLYVAWQFSILGSRDLIKTKTSLLLQSSIIKA